MLFEKSDYIRNTFRYEIKNGVCYMLLPIVSQASKLETLYLIPQNHKEEVIQNRVMK